MSYVLPLHQETPCPNICLIVVTIGSILAMSAVFMWFYLIIVLKV